jgi:hypothetical protein
VDHGNPGLRCEKLVRMWVAVEGTRHFGELLRFG